MKYKLNYLLIAFLLLVVTSCSQKGQSGAEHGITIENKEFSLTISHEGKALSLKHKPSGQECLEKGINTPIFAVTQYRPYQNELFLALPTKSTTFYPDTVYREGDNLVVIFDKIFYKAIIGLNITDNYIGFKLNAIGQQSRKGLFNRESEHQVDEFTLMQLPVRNRGHFGDWLNVAWDKDVAVNLLATDPYCKIDAEARDGFHIMKAGMEQGVKITNVGAALIATKKDNLLNCIDQLEEDYNLPHGVKSRRSEAYKYSYYEVYDANPQNIDEHIAYAKRGGFKAFVIFYFSFSSTMGHYTWLPEYPNGIEDLKAMIKKIEDAGMVPGIHIHYNKATKDDKYVSPVPDPRLNLTQIFTLSEPIDANSETIMVEENPDGCTMSREMRLLKLGDELVEYKSFTTVPPFQFIGCKRGQLDSKVASYPKGFKFGKLDVDTWTKFVRFDQRTSIQEEVAREIGKLYTETGFKFVYFDGAEDVHPPYWFNVANSQYKVYKCLDPEPLFSEGAAKAHFSWHMISRGNAFDKFPPEKIKQTTDKYMVGEAKFISDDFTSLNFGWNDYVAPNEKTIGMQSDMYEYICSRAAGYSCPIALIARFDAIKAHPRTPDNFEVMHRWEDAKLQNYFTDEQKEELKDTEQEHILLVNENGEFELQPYRQISGIPIDSSVIRAFAFARHGKSYIVYWHTYGQAEIELNVQPGQVKLFKDLGREVPVKELEDKVILPVAGRHYLEFNLPQKDAIKTFRSYKIIETTVNSNSRWK